MAIHKKKYRFRLSAFPAQQRTPSTITNYITRMTRWMRLRLSMLLLVVLLLEFLSECLPLALYLMWAANYIFNVPYHWTFFGYVLYCMTMDFILITCIQGGFLPVPFYKYLVAWFFRELMVFLIFLNALKNPQIIQWGKRTYKVNLGGQTTIIKDEI